MEIKKIIKILEDEIKKGYNHIYFDRFNTLNYYATPDDDEVDDEYYITLKWYDDYDPPEKLIKDEHYSNIKCKVVSHWIEEDETFGTLEHWFSLKPISKLPEWFDEKDTHLYFEQVHISELCKHEEYLPIYTLTI